VPLKTRRLRMSSISASNPSSPSKYHEIPSPTSPDSPDTMDHKREKKKTKYGRVGAMLASATGHGEQPRPTSGASSSQSLIVPSAGTSSPAFLAMRSMSSKEFSPNNNSNTNNNAPSNSSYISKIGRFLKKKEKKKEKDKIEGDMELISLASPVSGTLTQQQLSDILIAFKNILDEVIRLMAADSFRRFTYTKGYKDWLNHKNQLSVPQTARTPRRAQTLPSSKSSLVPALPDST